SQTDSTRTRKASSPPYPSERRSYTPNFLAFQRRQIARTPSASARTANSRLRRQDEKPAGPAPRLGRPKTTHPSTEIATASTQRTTNEEEFTTQFLAKMK